MALRETITLWHTAVCLLEGNKFQEASAKLLQIENPSAKILYNLGCICMMQQSYKDAIEYFNISLQQDKYLAIAYFQRGVCYHQIQRNDRAELDFLTAQSMVHCEDGIDYKQLGASVILNPSLLSKCVAVTRDTYKMKLNLDLPALPVKDCVFRPPKAMVDNLVKHDFLGKAKIISSTQENDIVYAASKLETLSPKTVVDSKLVQASSLPSSPFTPRHVLKAKATKMLMPPPPTRPPPRLVQNPDFSNGLRTKSRSTEILSTCENLYEDVDSQVPCVEKPVITKPQPMTRVHFRSTGWLSSNGSAKVRSSEEGISSMQSDSKGTCVQSHQNQQGRSIQRNDDRTKTNQNCPNLSKRPDVSHEFPFQETNQSISAASSSKSVLSRVHPSLLTSSNQDVNFSQDFSSHPTPRARTKFSVRGKSDQIVMESGAGKDKHFQPVSSLSQNNVTNSQKSPKPDRPPPPKFTR